MALSKEQKLEILAKPFQLWPDPKPGKEYGPSPKQKLIFIEDMPDDRRPHFHPKDYCLYIGAAQAGKTVTGVALATKKCLTYPGIGVIYGARTFKDLEEIVVEKFKEKFTIETPWDHPLVHRPPTQNRQSLEFTNGSKIRFMHFDDVLRLRGRTADVVIMEEATQLPDSKSFEEMGRRLSSIKAPILQVLLLTNNPESRNWIYDKFSLKQFTPSYMKTGGPHIPIGPICSCQLCQTCLYPPQDVLNTGVEAHEVEYKDHKCPDCGTNQDFYILHGKKYYCPGKQEYWRVIQTSSQDNIHLASTYVQDNIGAMDGETGRLYIQGQFLELRKGFVYWAFTDHNVLPTNEPINWSKNLIWSFDFNTSFQCSVVCQEYGPEDEEIVYQVDEVIIPESRPNGPEYIVMEFIQKLKEQSTPDQFEDFKENREIHIYGDINGWNRNMGTSQATYYQIILNELKKAGFKIQVKVRKIKGHSLIPVMTKVNSSNMMFCSQLGEKRYYVNPKCVYTINSLEGTRFKFDGKTINDVPDKKAAEDTDKSRLFCLTHPSDALGYYLAKRFPIIGDRMLNPFIQIPGEEMIELTTKGIKETSFKSQEEVEEKKVPNYSMWEELAKLNNDNGGLEFYW